ncbi:hypothetical protein WR25_13139 [Diploscapter pachys]|uniref:NPHP4 C2-like domain-containing protein n=1 Tax=Diploscapter pachys TaxID=2018661 RepID=A0A2A2LPV8_9BILA|nr:hypothetical protein WR25_13139 [Diploscapter pachys]
MTHESRPVSSIHGDFSRELSPGRRSVISERAEEKSPVEEEQAPDQRSGHVKFEMEQTSDEITEQLEREEHFKHQLPPIQQRKSIIKKPRIEDQKSIEELIESQPDEIQSQHDPIYKVSINLAKCGFLQFTKILDRNGDQPELVDFRGPNIVDIKRELHDRLETNEIIFQFLAYKRFDLPNFNQNHQVFFTMQFYRFSELTTEELFLLPPEKRSDPSVLVRTDAHGNHIEDAPGFTAKFIVDRNSSRNGEEDEFIQFLSNARICIDVWDAISLLHIGTVAYYALEESQFNALFNAQ